MPNVSAQSVAPTLGSGEVPNAQPRAVPARNRRIGEFLKELGLAEGRLTGLPRVFRAMEANGLAHAVPHVANTLVDVLIDAGGESETRKALQLLRQDRPALGSCRSIGPPGSEHGVEARDRGGCR